tara:strand:+ start:3784 stop:4077 length:294 start_codon:yes stop_codon:yes gene_type:complete
MVIRCASDNINVINKNTTMEYNVRVNGWDFEFVSQDEGQDEFYQCRGEVMYDDEHDQIPEPSLWQAALKLESMLIDKGVKANADHSEKGWVEVTLNK